VSGELVQEAAAAFGDAERLREAARVLGIAADEVQSLVQAVAQRFDPAIWRGESARLAEDQLLDIRERLHRAAAELNGVAWTMQLRSARLADSAEQLDPCGAGTRRGAGRKPVRLHRCHRERVRTRSRSAGTLTAGSPRSRSAHSTRRPPGTAAGAGRDRCVRRVCPRARGRPYPSCASAALSPAALSSCSATARSAALPSMQNSLPAGSAMTTQPLPLDLRRSSTTTEPSASTRPRYRASSPLTWPTQSHPSRRPSSFRSTLCCRSCSGAHTAARGGRDAAQRHASSSILRRHVLRGAAAGSSWESQHRGNQSRFQEDSSTDQPGRDTRSRPARPASGPATSSGRWPRRAVPTGRTPPGR